MNNQRNTSSQSRVYECVLIPVIVVVLLVAASVGTVASATIQPGNHTRNISRAGENTEQFAIKQGDNCYSITPLGNETDSIVSFYDYRGHEQGYSSHGTTGLQIKDTSQFFFYQGSSGLNLVMLHGQWAGNVSPGGGAVTLKMDGLPATGGWAIKDDGYPTTTDSLTSNGSMATASWTWSGGRSDGGVYQADPAAWNSRIRITPHFNKEAAGYPDPDWEGRESENQVQRWIVRSGDGSAHALNLSQSVTIESGMCAPHSNDDNQPHSTVSELKATNQVDTATDEEMAMNATNNKRIPTTTVEDSSGETAATGPGFGITLSVFVLAVALIAIIRWR